MTAEQPPSPPDWQPKPEPGPHGPPSPQPQPPPPKPKRSEEDQLAALLAGFVSSAGSTAPPKKGGRKKMGTQVPPTERPPDRLSRLEAERFREILEELQRRDAEALKIFQPLPEQERFFASHAPERLAVGGNRSGKTSAACVEIARCATNQDPYNKYPHEGGNIVLVGRDLKHCGRVFYAKLFKPGAFQIIKDRETGQWRTWNPNNEDDARRILERRPAPPLIPKRFYKKGAIAWAKKSDECPTTITLTTGWVVHFFPSGGVMPQGWPVSLVAFDEEIERAGWYQEMSARLIDNRKVLPNGHVQGGKFIWSATPQAATIGLYELQSRAEECQHDDNPPIIQCNFGMLDNTYVEESSKREFIEKFAEDQDQIDIRVHGISAILGTRVYPNFYPRGVHAIETFIIPDNWTRYAIIDPGHTICATLFIAIPPPLHHLEDTYVIYDELYLKKANATIWAQSFADKVGTSPIQCGIIDSQAARISDLGSGKTVEEQYSAALEHTRFKFVRGGTSFVWSNPELNAGLEAVRGRLHVRNGKPGIVVMVASCRNFVNEMLRYSNRKTPEGIVTDQPIKKNDHLCDCLRYACLAELRYEKPVKRAKVKGYTTIALEQKKLREKYRNQKIGETGSSYKLY